MCFLLISLCIFSMALADYSLSPSPISYPQTFWCVSPILLSSNHAGEIVTLTLSANTLPFLAVGTYIEITIPNFPLPTLSKSLTDPKPAYADFSLTFSSVSLPNTPGIYGPISVLILLSPTGQILASNKVFASLGILGPKPVPNQVTVTNLGSTALSATTSLSFLFSLSIDLQKFDTMVLWLDSAFSVKTPGITWDNLQSGTPFFNTTGIYADTTTNSITFYGLQQPILEAVTVGFTVSNILTPASVPSSSMFRIEILRFGTNTVLQRYSSTGNWVVAGVLAITWAPSNNYLSSSQLVNGNIAYMSLSFTLIHQIPALGGIEIVFSGVDISATSSLAASANQLTTANSAFSTAYLDYSPHSLISCAVLSATEVQCSASSPVPAGTLITIYNLVTFTGTPAEVTMSKTYDGNLLIIDMRPGAYTLTYSSTSVLLAAPNIYITNSISGDFSSTAVYSTGAYTSAAISISFQSPVTFASTTPISIFAAVVDSANAADFAISLASPLYGNVLLAGSAVYDFSTSSYALNSIPSITSTGISFTPDPFTVYAMDWVNVLIYSGSQDTLGTFNAPNFSSNKYTRYEIGISFTSGSTLYQYLQPLTLVPYSISTSSFSLMCLSISWQGIPATASLTPNNAYTPASGYSAYILFTLASSGAIDSTLNTGLASGSTFPCSGNPIGSVLTIQYAAGSTSSTSLRLDLPSGLGQIPISISFPFGIMDSGLIYTTSISICALNNANGENFIMGQTTVASLTAPADNSVVITESVSNSMQANTTITNYQIVGTVSNVASTNFAVILTAGFELGASMSVTFNGEATIALELFPSGDSQPSYVVGYGVTPAFTVITDITYTLSQFTSPAYDYNTQIMVLFGFSGIANSDCYYSLTNTITLNVQSLNSKFYYPINSSGFGANNQVETFILILESPPGIVYTQDYSITFLITNTLAAPISCRVKIGESLLSSTLTGYTCVASPTAPSATGDIYLEATVVLSPVYLPAYLAVFSSATVLYLNGVLYEWSNSPSGFTGTKTFMEVSAQPKASGIKYVGSFPQYAGAMLAQFSIVFTAGYELPAGSLLSIVGEVFQDDVHADLNTWCSAGFTSASVLSGVLHLYTAQTIVVNQEVSIVKDAALNIVSAGASAAFLITATYMGATILEDTLASALPVQNIIFQSPPGAYFTSPILASEVQNCGSLSNYTLTFSISILMSEVWYLVIDFPTVYNAEIGNAVVKYLDTPDVYYLDTSSYLKQCIADHWTVYCGGFGAVLATHNMTVSFLAYNPAANSQGNYTLYIMNSIGVVQAATTVGVLNFVGSPSGIADLTGVSFSDHLNSSASCSFTFLVKQVLSVGDFIIVEFPPQFVLDVYNPTAACYGNYNVSGTVSDLNGGCKVVNNNLVYTVGADVVLDSTDAITLNVTGIIKPIYGWIRSPDLYFDSVSTLFTVYDYWTDKFTIKTRTAQGVEVSESFSNLDSAYTGYFFDNWEKIQITCPNSQYSDSIMVIKPGTYSSPCSFSVSNSALLAFALEITPTSALYFDKLSYVLTRSFPTATFLIGAPEDMQEGVYYIDWSIVETPLVPNTFLYGRIPKTQVQVHLGTPAQILVDLVPGVPNGAKTYPIGLILDNCSPFHDFAIAVKLSTPDPRVSISPASLSFGRDIPVMHYQLVFNQTLGLIPNNTAFRVVYTLSGASASAFSDISPTTLFFYSTQQSAHAIKASHITVVSPKSARLTLELNNPSIVYWAFGPSSSFLYSFYYSDTYVSRYAYPLFGSPTVLQLLISDQLSNYKDYLYSLSSEADWASYQVQLRAAAIDHVIFAADFLDSGEHLLQTVDFLLANMNYTLVVWANNYFENDTAVTWATTAPLPPPALLMFEAGSSSDRAIEIYSALATAFQIPQWQLVPYLYPNPKDLDTQHEILWNAEYQYVLTPMQTLEGTSSSRIVKALEEFNVSSNYSLTYRAAVQADFGVPGLSGVSFEEVADTIVINFTSSADGNACCIVEFEPDNNASLSNTDILNGLNREGTVADYYGCTEVGKGSKGSVVIGKSLLVDPGNYTITCTACDDFPIESYCLGLKSFVTEQFEILGAVISYAGRIWSGILAIAITFT